MAVDTFAVFIMREPFPDPGDGVNTFVLGDIVRAFIPQQVMIDNPGTAQPRKCVLVVDQVQPPFSDLQWETLQRSMTQPNPAYPDPLPPDWDEMDEDAQQAAMIDNRQWSFDFDAVYDSELNPPDRTFMDALRAELTTAPYGAKRAYKDVRGVVIRSKETGQRQNT